MVKFLRRCWSRYSRFGLRRKKQQKWRKPTGRHNKMREKRRGYPVVVSIGYAKPKVQRNKIENKKPVKIMNAKELAKVGRDSIIIVGKVGLKKKIEIIKKAEELKIPVMKTNTKKFLEKNKIRGNQK